MFYLLPFLVALALIMAPGAALHERLASLAIFSAAAAVLVYQLWQLRRDYRHIRLRLEELAASVAPRAALLNRTVASFDDRDPDAVDIWLTEEAACHERALTEIDPGTYAGIASSIATARHAYNNAVGQVNRRLPSLNLWAPRCRHYPFYEGDEKRLPRTPGAVQQSVEQA